MLIVHITRCKKSHFLSTRSVLAVTQKYAKNALLAGLCPGSRQESARCSPDSLVGWGVDTPPHRPHLTHAAPSAIRSSRRRSPLVPPPKPGAPRCFRAGYVLACASREAALISECSYSPDLSQLKHVRPRLLG